MVNAPGGTRLCRTFPSIRCLWIGVPLFTGPLLRPAFFWLIFAFSCVAPANAGPFFLEYFGGVSDTTLDGITRGPAINFNPGPLSQISFSHTLDTGPFTYTNPNGIGSTMGQATGSGTVSLGQITGSAFDTAQTTSAELPTGAETIINMDWDEVITVAGPAEADGFVHLPWTLDTSELVKLGGADHSSSDFAEGLFRITASMNPISLLDQTIADIVHPGDADLTQSHHLSGTFVLGPGTQFGLSVITDPIVAASSPSGGPATGNVNVESIFHLDPDPVSGGSYVTSSGVTFVTPATSAVPEPSSLAILMSGLGVAALARRRRPRR